MTEERSNEQRPDAVERLPPPYAVALQMRGAGAADLEISEALGIELAAFDRLTAEVVGEAERIRAGADACACAGAGPG